MYTHSSKHNTRLLSFLFTFWLMKDLVLPKLPEDRREKQKKINDGLDRMIKLTQEMIDHIDQPIDTKQPEQE